MSGLNGPCQSLICINSKKFLQSATASEKEVRNFDYIDSVYSRINNIYCNIKNNNIFYYTRAINVVLCNQILLYLLPID